MTDSLNQIRLDFQECLEYHLTHYKKRKEYTRTMTPPPSIAPHMQPVAREQAARGKTCTPDEAGLYYEKRTCCPICNEELTPVLGSAPPLGVCCNHGTYTMEVAKVKWRK